MFEADIAAENSPSAVGEHDVQFVPWRIVELRAMPDYRLFQRFADGTEGFVEMRELIFSDHAGVFTSLRNPEVFAEVSIDPAFGSVLWANGLDIAPDATYEDIQRHGVRILR